LDAGIALCECINEGSYPAKSSHAKVIVSLVHHAVELFLKYAIRRRTGNAPPTHYLRELRAIYEDLFPDESFDFDVPFITHYLGFEPAEIVERLEEEKKDKSRGNQRLRYHLDRKGWPWGGVHGLTPEFYLAQVKDLRGKLLALSATVEKAFGQQITQAGKQDERI
jgi:hypothetical protein